MDLNSIKPGLKIKTNTEVNRPGATRGMLIKQPYLDARLALAEGTVHNWVPGHGGDVWWVEHTDGSIAAYCFNEFDPL